MPRGDKSTYTDKQKRQAEHIEEGYEQRGVPEDEAARRAWATVNKMTGGGKQSGSGRGKKINTAPAKTGGHKGGAATAARSFASALPRPRRRPRPANAAPPQRATEDQARTGASVCQACTHAIPSTRGTLCQEIPRWHATHTVTPARASRALHHSRALVQRRPGSPGLSLSCRSTMPAACITISGWRWMACSRAGRSRRAPRPIRHTSASPCRSRTIPWPTRPSRAPFRQGSMGPEP